MFYYLNGITTKVGPSTVVVDCAGVGYAVFTSQNTISKLTDSQVHKLYTYLHVREDVFDLYGFYDMEELSCFKLLIGISGVGPKAALSILSVTTPGKFALAIVSGDDKPLLAAQGIGKKLAQRVIIELKDKLSKEQFAVKGVPSDFALNKQGDKASEAMSALVVLGYSQSEASLALSSFDYGDMTLEDTIKQALKRLTR